MVVIPGPQTIAAGKLDARMKLTSVFSSGGQAAEGPSGVFDHSQPATRRARGIAGSGRRRALDAPPVREFAPPIRPRSAAGFVASALRRPCGRNGAAPLMVRRGREIRESESLP